MSGITNNTPIKVLAVTAWNVLIGGAIKVDLDANAFTLGDDKESQVGIDYGSSASLASVRFDIPDVLSQSILADNASTTTLMTMIDPLSLSTKQGFIVHFHLAYQVV